ncbi:MAG: hypothetical protein R2716_04735 [Microthrixaceae bacterium]
MKRASAMLGLLAAAVAAYVRWVGPWQRSWGATSAEVRGALPCDGLVREPAQQVTRAISVAAPPEDVWPWVVQIGADRGGFYSYDWLENLMGLGIHSADDVVGAWQDLAVGDIVAADRARSGGWVVEESRPPELLVLRVADVGSGRPVDRDDGFALEFMWTFALQPGASGGTRLVVRERSGTSGLLAPGVRPAQADQLRDLAAGG